MEESQQQQIVLLCRIYSLSQCHSPERVQWSSQHRSASPQSFYRTFGERNNLHLIHFFLFFCKNKCLFQIHHIIRAPVTHDTEHESEITIVLFYIFQSWLIDFLDCWTDALALVQTDGCSATVTCGGAGEQCSQWLFSCNWAERGAKPPCFQMTYFIYSFMFACMWN